jgi:hypothetical protein
MFDVLGERAIFCHALQFLERTQELLGFGHITQFCYESKLSDESDGHTRYKSVRD